MILKKYLDFINEEKEDDGNDNYYDNQFGKLEEEISNYKRNKYKLDSLIKTYDYSENADRNLNKIINSNSLLLQHWSILKKKKRVMDLNDKNEELKKEISEMNKDEASKEDIEKKQEKIDSNIEEINKIEKEHKDLEKELIETEKETIRKITDLKKKLVD